MAKALTWAGGEHDFELRLVHLRALQDKCDAGPQWILMRLTSKQWFIDDVIQPIRLGLEGGGMEKEAARKLVQKFVEDRPLTLSVLTAQAVLMVALFGDEDDQPGERKAGAKKTRTRSRAESGNSTASTNGPE
ncbi:gene transfer agent family protein [Brucella pseudogrignonensis]|uniref:gene transfer agent family protein n=1 Tax=Brucella pseudogrignonensis TaxID=419475 RepID=UPI0028B2F7A3|nr:gene transfer agent family protein [Brucella pseudogrignonensis]MDT6938553.1 gene transfer agent family protein [Brucella pseudogrignonensis]MDT6940735.1 gene transfer agent family protein [Brucella pseudogrignonensis]MDT6940743.1 gene transfer agent family protein [Brucella pseudogrignonensis]MDT6942574.1 gene transfer agent family protein [Brucella pseudogrignonensis]MDT6942616.1 gene transfer agent family protein [Brucella pseudogrignonensis]